MPPLTAPSLVRKEGGSRRLSAGGSAKPARRSRTVLAPSQQPRPVFTQERKQTAHAGRPAWAGRCSQHAVPTNCLAAVPVGGNLVAAAVRSVAADAGLIGSWQGRRRGSRSLDRSRDRNGGLGVRVLRRELIEPRNRSRGSRGDGCRRDAV